LGIIAVHDLGGEGPALLLVHATGFCGQVFEPLAAALGGRFRCLALDIRGHGDSGAPTGGDFAWAGFARDVLAVVDGLGLEHPFGFGHSSGGAALLLAEEDRPSTFAALYCFEPVVFPAELPLPTENPLAASARRRRVEFASRDEALANFASKPPLSTLDPAALAAYVDHCLQALPDGRVRLKCRPEHEAAVYEASFGHDAYARLGSVACPLTLACGERTEALGPPMLEAMAARAPRARVEVIEGLGHFGPLEDPLRVAASVAAAFGGGASGEGEPSGEASGGQRST
jgi:pimeloyl-ACP methyl ester carboxylesterase